VGAADQNRDVSGEGGGDGGEGGDVHLIVPWFGCCRSLA
jgi:hypothetical protein